MLDPDIRILRQMEDARFEHGKTVPIIRVEFNVGDHGPFVERLLKETFTTDTRDAVLNTWARQVRTT
jgi:hypothetical protein